MYWLLAKHLRGKGQRKQVTQSQLHCDLEIQMSVCLSIQQGFHNNGIFGNSRIDFFFCQTVLRIWLKG